MKRLFAITASAVMTLALGTAVWAGGTEDADEGTETVVAAGSGQYNEAPMLAARVAAGELPPVDERLPVEPKVIVPFEMVGRYGGTITTFNPDSSPWGDLSDGPENGSAFLLELSYDGEIVADIATDYEMSDDNSSMLLTLREGLKWSNGDPFTADDILFRWEAINWIEEVSFWGGGAPATIVDRVVKIDDRTVRYESDGSLAALPVFFTHWPGSHWVSFSPSKYLSKYHINYNEDANSLAKEEGHDTWVDAFNAHMQVNPLGDLDKPVVLPWFMKEFTTTHRVYERNPYFYEVDTAGNQLPYIDTIVNNLAGKETIDLKIVSGEADVQAYNTSFANYTLYKESEASAGYTVYPIPGILGSQLAFGFNLNHEDPVLRALFNDVQFRRGMSLAIDRDEMNEAIFFGLATPRQATVDPTASFYKKEWGEAYAQFDPAEANRLLDEAGMSARDGDGFRLRPDGERFELILEYFFQADIPQEMYDLVKEYWENVGIRVQLNEMQRELYFERSDMTDRMVGGMIYGNTLEVVHYLTPNHWAPPSGDFGVWPTWGIWLRADQQVRNGQATLADFTDGVLPGEEPPDDFKNLFNLLERRLQTVMGSPEYMEISETVLDWHAENVLVIGTVGLAPTLYVANSKLGNIPPVYNGSAEWQACLFYDSQQLFYKE